MVPLTLDGVTLGEKHRSYNELVNKGFEPIDSIEDDLQILLKIDIASKKRDINYMLEVLKSEDQLYVSKAIKRSTWLITDQKYAYIMNPEHLYTQLRPAMTTSAFNKLMLNIRLHLRDYKRVEEFYNYIKKQQLQSAFKWLQHCSVQFLEGEVLKHGENISGHLLLRLFEKSFSIFEKYILNQCSNYTIHIKREFEFIAVKYPDKFLDLLKSLKQGFSLIFGRKGTKIVMEKCPEKILNNFELFGPHLDLPTFSKILSKKQSIEEFLLQHVNNAKLEWLYSYDRIRHFINYIPKETRFVFVKKVFIDKEIYRDQKKHETDKRALFYYQCSFKCAQSNSQNTNLVYQWYRFAPFEIAFTDLKKLIRAESAPAVRCEMFQVLLMSAGRNTPHIHTLLQYYHDKHINEPLKFKSQFINYFISRVDTHYLDDKTWKILNQLFHSMEVYIASENNVQSCIRSIIVKNIVQNEDIPIIIQQKFVFDSLKYMQKKLKTQQEKSSVFDFLYNTVTKKYKKLNLTVKQEFDEAASLCKILLNLINDWNKELTEYPDALEAVKELNVVNKDKEWGHDLSPLYTLNKSWKKALFKESISLLCSESVCINALKHDPGVLSHHRNEVVAMCCDDNMSLTHLLSKIRLYWPDTLAIDWKNAYLERLDQPDGHKALVVGLCTLLPQKGINELLRAYAPSKPKIEWDDTNQVELSLRKQIAKNIYKARPLASIEEILPYAKGDYLQFAVPSLSSILSQLSSKKSRQAIPTLLDSPVSLQKFGVRCAFHKLNTEELNPMLTDVWNSTKNSSIRAILFTQTFTMLCEVKNVTHAKYTWELLSTFIDKLTTDENKLIYQKLGDITKVPHFVKPQFYMKSYVFLRSLPPKCNCDYILQRMQYQATFIMDSLDDDFVVNVLLKDFMTTMTKERSTFTYSSLFSSFILSSKDEEMQIRRYQKSLAPILKQVLPLWEKVYEDDYDARGQYSIKIQVNNIFERMVNDLDTFTLENRKHIPTKTFYMMQSELEKSLSYQKDYVFLTTWKFVTTFIKLLNDNSHVLANFEREGDKDLSDEEKEKMYNEIHKHIAPLFAKLCVQILKEDSIRYGSSIYLLFTVAFNQFFHDYLSSAMGNVKHRLEYAKCLLQYHEEKEVWLVISIFLRNNLNRIDSDNSKQRLEEIREIVNLQASDEIKIHFYELFSRVTPFVLGAKSGEKESCKF